MKRVIISLSLLLLLLCVAQAQSISQYEYWTDDDYNGRTVVSSSGGDVSLNVSTEPLAAGVHFLNFRACRSDGVWGNFYRYLYYIPVLKSAASGGVDVEYWLDDNLAGRRTESASGRNLSLAIDVSTLTSGVHYFNCTPIADTGERGSSERYLFYIPMALDNASVSPVKGLEYWIDDNYAGKHVEQNSTQTPILTVGIGDLASGIHYFNCRTFNERREYGNPVREMFYIPHATSYADAKMASFEYWIDDDYANRVTSNSADSEQAFTIDVSQLSGGVHYFNYWPIDDKGRRGSVIRSMFYKAGIVEASASGICNYEYWIDDDTSNKVTGTAATGELIFNIDVSALDVGSHTFNFRAKDVLEQWGETYSEAFQIDFDDNMDKIIIQMAGTIRTSCSKYDLDFTDVPNLKAYIASGYNPSSGEVLLTRVYKTPAGEGLLLKGDAGDYEVPVTETSVFYTNLLKGVTSATNISPKEGSYTNFILANGSHGIGFYTLSQAGEIDAGKAYLQLPTSAISSNGARGLTIRFDDEDGNPTAVEGVENQKQGPCEYFDLQGRKVVNGTAKNGIYIIRSADSRQPAKKVFIK